jgi:biotin carboxyl carrier protein
VRMELKSGERTFELKVSVNGDHCQVDLDGQAIALEILAARGAELDLRLAGKRYRALVAATRDERHVFLDGAVFTFRMPVDADEMAEADQAGGPDLVSQMPGTIVKVLVEVGQEVPEGARLLIIESMKMETEMTAPVAGKISRIHVQAGQTVGLAEPLLDIEPTRQPGEAPSP